MKKLLSIPLIALSLSLGACSTSNPPVTMDNGLIIEDLKVGSGDAAVAGNTLVVHYVGTLEDGTQFDSSRDRGEPFPFELGAGYVIKGWDQGMEGMQVGGLRKLTIPSELGYQDNAVGSIPPNSTLIFEVELLEIQ